MRRHFTRRNPIFTGKPVAFGTKNFAVKKRAKRLTAYISNGYNNIDIKISIAKRDAPSNGGQMSGDISLQTFHRMPQYLKTLYEFKKEGRENVSSVQLAEALDLTPSIVKKDLSQAKVQDGKPKVGYAVDDLIAGISEFLGYNDLKEAVLVGVGKLGQALLGYTGFGDYGLDIVAGFDIDDGVIGTKIHGKPILPTGKLEGAVEKLGIKIAILTVPADHAQAMADVLVRSGIRAIWNFTTAHIQVPDSVAVRNENMASSLAVLSAQLAEIMKKEQESK